MSFLFNLIFSFSIIIISSVGSSAIIVEKDYIESSMDILEGRNKNLSKKRAIAILINDSKPELNEYQELQKLKSLLNSEVELTFNKGLETHSIFPTVNMLATSVDKIKVKYHGDQNIKTSSIGGFQFTHDSKILESYIAEKTVAANNLDNLEKKFSSNKRRYTQAKIATALYLGARVGFDLYTRGFNQPSLLEGLILGSFLTYYKTSNSEEKKLEALRFLNDVSKWHKLESKSSCRIILAK